MKPHQHFQHKNKKAQPKTDFSFFWVIVHKSDANLEGDIFTQANNKIHRYTFLVNVTGRKKTHTKSENSSNEQQK